MRWYDKAAMGIGWFCIFWIMSRMVYVVAVSAIAYVQILGNPEGFHVVAWDGLSGVLLFLVWVATAWYMYKAWNKYTHVEEVEVIEVEDEPA